MECDARFHGRWLDNPHDLGAKGVELTIGFLKKGFIRLRELWISRRCFCADWWRTYQCLAGVETAWVETTDYLADTWSVFVAQVKSMWNSTVGFLRKAWIKLKSLFDDDVNVEVEMAKIDKEIRTADEAEENKKQQAIADRMKRRDARKQQIESNRVQMQEGIKQQLEERRKARAGRDIDGEMAVIDQETEAKNKTVDASKEEQFKQNEAAGLTRQRLSMTPPLAFKRLLIKCVRKLALPAKRSPVARRSCQGA